MKQSPPPADRRQSTASKDGLRGGGCRETVCAAQTVSRHPPPRSPSLLAVDCRRSAGGGLCFISAERLARCQRRVHPAGFFWSKNSSTPAPVRPFPLRRGEDS